MDIQRMLADSLTAHDRQRDRSKQKAIGPSAIGGCARRVWHQLVDTEETNHLDGSLAAIMGTYIHSGIADAIRREDPFGDNFLIEQRLEHPVITGNVDLFVKDEGHVVDWKTTTKKSLRYFPSQAQRWQVQIYGWLLSEQGYIVRKVSLVAISRDGEMEDIRVHTEDYDPDAALQGLLWLENVRGIVEEGGPAPAPEKSFSFCHKYCPYYNADAAPDGSTGCPSS